MHQEILQWLRRQPGWEQTDLDALGITGLFPLGLQILQRKTDILGGEKCRYRVEYDLFAQGYGDPPALPALNGLPTLGQDQQAQLRLGHLQRTAPDGLRRWQIKLRIEFTA